MLLALFNTTQQKRLNRAAICGYLALCLPAGAAAVLFVLLGNPVMAMLKVLGIPLLIILMFTMFWLYRWHWGMAIIFAFIGFNIGYSLLNVDPELASQGYGWVTYVFGAIFAVITALGMAFVWAYHTNQDINKVK